MKNLQIKFPDNKNILIVLVSILLLVSITQSFFLVKLYRSTSQDNAVSALPRDLGQRDFPADDFFKPFDADKWDPIEELKSMRERMERLFDDSHNRFKSSPFFGRNHMDSYFLPQTDLIEEDNNYIVKMNIPGTDAAEINVKLEGDTLSVMAKTQHSTGDKNKSLLHMERSLGVFRRSLTLPGPVEEGKMKTEYENGVLTIILPKKVG